MSFLEWAAKRAANSAPPAPSGLMQSVATPQTFSDWVDKKRDVFRPENRIHNLVAKAEDLIDAEDFEDAIAVLTEAMSLAPTDSQLFANRSFCYERLEDWDKSLSDAQMAIELSDKAADRQMKNKDPKETDNGGTDAFKYRNKLMFYRKARALRHKKSFQEAIDALVMSKALVIECQFIDEEIRSIKLEVICDMGYDRSDVEEVCDRFQSLTEIIAHLNENKKLMITDTSCDHLPSNPFGYRGLYINGLAADLEDRQSELEQLMASCGEVIRCKVYSNKEQSRAIIAFSEEPESSQSVRKAIRLIHSHKELIRDQSSDNLIVRYRHTCMEGGTDLRTDPQNNFKGTVIGGECYKWRTTGCEDSDCSGLHIPICHHLDQQSIETTDTSKRKRRQIVFDLDEKTPSSPTTPTDPRLSRKLIKFDLNGETNETPIGLSGRIKLNHKRTESQDSETPKAISTEKKVIRLTVGSHSANNGLSADTDSPKTGEEATDKKKQRKRIVFDLKSDDESTDSTKDGTSYTESTSAVTTGIVIWIIIIVVMVIVIIGLIVVYFFFCKAKEEETKKSPTTPVPKASGDLTKVDEKAVPDQAIKPVPGIEKPSEETQTKRFSTTLRTNSDEVSRVRSGFDSI